MNSRQRIEAILEGRTPDRPPFSFWSHFPGIDLDPDKLAHTCAKFGTDLGVDFLKSMPNGLYCVEDWGCVCDFSEVAKGGMAQVTDPAIKEINDWAKITKPDCTQGTWGRELSYLQKLRALLPDDIPLIATVFSPLTIAAKLSRQKVLEHIQLAPEKVHSAMEIITNVTADFSRQALEIGCDGLFFASQTVCRQDIDEASFKEFGRNYDIRCLELSNGGGWLSVTHMHGADIHFNLMADYPTSCINWHMDESPPTLLEYRNNGGNSCVMGGLSRNKITNGEVQSILQDIDDMAQAPGIDNLIFSPCCGMRHPYKIADLQTISQKIISLKK